MEFFSQWLVAADTPQGWDWFWAWTGDEVVWVWVRTAIAALFGALAGGGFTLWGQSRQAGVQRDLQERQFAAETKATEERLEGERDAAAYERSLAAAIKLFEEFTALQRAVQAAKPSFRDHTNGSSWKSRWAMIWTEDVSLDIDVGSRLIPDVSAQMATRRLVRLLDQLANITSNSGYPGAINITLRAAASQLTAEGIEVMGAYIRREQRDSERARFLDVLDDRIDDFVKWEEQQIAASEAPDEPDHEAPSNDTP